MDHQARAAKDETDASRLDWVPSIAVPLILFVVVPAAVASNNEIDVISIPPTVWLRLLALAIVAGGVLLGIRWALENTRFSHLYSRLMLFLGFFILFAGFFFPVSRDFEIGAFQTAPVHWVNLAIVTLLAVVMTYLATREYRRYVAAAVGVFLVGNVLVSLIPQNVAEARMAEQASIGASSNFNIFVVSFDGLSRTIMDHVMAEDPELRGRLSGFTIFSQAGASSPATTASIAAELYGNRNYKLWHDTLLELRRHDPENLLTNVLYRNGFQTTTFGTYRIEFEGTGLTSSPTVDQTGLMLLEGSLARTLTRVAVPKGASHDTMDSYLSLQNPSSPEHADLMQRILDSPTTAGIKEHTATVIDYQDFLSKLEVVTDDPAALFVHFTHTHFPVEFDGGCEYRAHDREWFRSHQDFEGALDEHRCAASQLAQFLDEVEELGLIEKSLIILKGDHGKPTAYAPEGSIEATPINGNSRFGISRYAPFLAIKPVDALLTVEPRTDTQPVLLDDLARTLCEESGIDHDCDSYPGYNILRDVVDPGSEVTIFVPESADSSYRFEDHVAITIQRGESVAQSLYDALEG